MAINTAQINTYPASYPVPNIQYSATIDYGVLRSAQQGFPDQARHTQVNPTFIQASFQMPLADFKKWSEWIDNYATDQWCSMRGIDQYAGNNPTDTLDDFIVRFSNIAMSVVGYNWVSVTAQLEVIPQDIGNAEAGYDSGVVRPPDIVSDWIVAGEPYSPSADWYIAGEPSTPSIDWVLGETPPDHRN